MNNDKKMEIEKESLGKRVKGSFTTRKFRGGAYATVLSVIAIAMILVVNLIVTKLDIRFDMTANGKYTLNEETVSLLKGLKDEITIYYLVTSGGEIDEFDRLFGKYDDYGDKVRLEYKDPVLYPRFAAEYVDDEIGIQSFLVVNETTGRAKYVPYAEIIVSEFDYYTFSSSVTGIDLEGKLDAAIQYVTNEHLPIMYTVAGHGETSMSGTAVADLLKKGNVTVNEIQLITVEKIPEDCDILFFYQPQSDYMEEEVAMIKEYLMDGGKAIFMVDFMTPELENFNSILTSYGVDVQEGWVAEEKSTYYMRGERLILLPMVYSNSITDSIRGKKYVISDYSSGMLMRDDIRSTITTTNLLASSSSSYITTTAEKPEKESGAPEGPFYLGLLLSESLMGEETKIAVFSSKKFLDDVLLSNSAYGNAEILMNTVNTLADQKNAVSVPVMSLSEDMLTLTSAQANKIAVIVGILLPLAIIGTGIFVVVRRRKK